MGKLRTANNRRNRAIRQTVERIRATAGEIVTAVVAKAPNASAKSAKAAS